MRLLALLFCLWCGNIAYADNIQFPPLTGRVVDDAHILSASSTQSLEQELADYENGTGNQVVVATIATLYGDTIEDYGYQLGRAWHIGQKGKDNGVLLIVAPKERKVRIEVGYGLEGVLTDTLSSEIVQGVIVPAFKSGNMEQGVVEGTHAILNVLGGKSAPTAAVSSAPANDSLSGFQILLLLVVIFFFVKFAFHHPFLAWFLLSGNTSRFGGSGLGGGGFSGGGGSFGGGGSSGGW